MGYGKYSCKTLSTLYPLTRKDASSDYRQPMTLQLFLLAIGVVLQQCSIKPATRKVAGRSPAMGFIFLFVAGLKANCCKSPD